MADSLKRVSVIGLGKLGIPLAACLGSKKIQTIGVDKDLSRVEAINRGICPIYEPGLQEKIKEAAGFLRATADYAEAVAASDATLIIVPTPSEPSGGFSLRYVREAGEAIGKALKEKKGCHLVVLTSTVMPGSTEGELKPLLEKASGKSCGTGFGLCYSPEFIALGSVIHDFLNPDFLLIGQSDPAAGNLLESLYQNVCDNKPPAAKMNFVNAELTKLSINTYVTAKITFANMLARICERLPKADVDAVTAALGLDNRIGRKYLKGAIGYGGPCFPRDNLALSSLARSVGVQAALSEATDLFNRQQVSWLKELVKSHLPPGGTAGILGLSYKPHSDVVEESQGLLLAQALAKDGVRVLAYEPSGMENSRRVLGGGAQFAPSAAECVAKSDVLVLTTPWEEFKSLSSREFSRQGKERTVIDCWRLLPGLSGQEGIRYVPLGKGSE